MLLTILPHASSPMLAIRTNIPAWAGTILNVEGEYYFSRRFSAALPVYYCPWFIAERRSLRVLALQPELRFRFKPSPGGHHVGIHPSIAWFNLRNGNYRYQDVGRPLLGGGVSYGYSLIFGRSWTADFSIGLGCASLQYERFYNTPNGAKVDTRRTFYWGVDKISLSIGYIIDL